MICGTLCNCTEFRYRGEYDRTSGLIPRTTSPEKKRPQTGFNIRTEQVSSFSRSPKPGPLCAVAMESGCGRERWRNQHAAAELGRNRANPRICPVISARSAPPFFRSSSRLLLSEYYRDSMDSSAFIIGHCVHLTKNVLFLISAPILHPNVMLAWLSSAQTARG